MQVQPATLNNSGRKDGYPLTAVRLSAIRMQPYVARAIYAVTLVPTPGLREKSGGWACDKYWRVYYDPETLKTETLEALAADLLHEIWHLLRRHAARFERLPRVKGAIPNHTRWNMSGDCEINDDPLLRRHLQDWCIFPYKFKLPDGKMAEWYFAKLPEEDEDEGGGDGDGESQPHDCGSGSGGQPREWEEGPPEEGGGDGDGDDDPGENTGGMSDGEGQAVREHVAEATREHIAQKGIGSVSASCRGWVAETLAPPTIPWQQTLSHIMRAAIQMSTGAEDFTYRRMNRRQSALGGIILPALFKPKIELAVVLDTSGSMSAKEVERGLSEINGICRAVGAAVTVFCCDTTAGPAQQVMSGARVEIDRRGGTDMGAGVAAAVKATPRPDVVIVITDGETGWPGKRSPVPVVVCFTPGVPEYWKDRAPDWAKTVTIEED